jgi:hypothetical protein
MRVQGFKGARGQVENQNPKNQLSAREKPLYRVLLPIAIL